jgi:hypothetical protein
MLGRMLFGNTAGFVNNVRGSWRIARRPRLRRESMEGATVLAEKLRDDGFLPLFNIYESNYLTSLVQAYLAARG